MRLSPTSLRRLATLALGLAVMACDGGRLNPGGGGRGRRTGGTPQDATVVAPVNKDAAVGADGEILCACDLTTACDPGCACDVECLALPPDTGVPNMCACDMVANVCDPGCACDPLCNAGCACDTTPNLCDPGCACDPFCGGNTDAGIHNCTSNPRGCSAHELMSPDCSCLGACEPGWRWDSASRSCVSTTGTPDSGTTTGCTVDSQCQPPSTVCESRQCVPGCANPGGISCGGGQVCNTQTGRCVNLAPDSGVVGPADSGVLPSDNFDVSTSALRYASALCQFRQRCEPALLQFTVQTPSQCEQEVRNGQAAIWNAYRDSVTASHVTFSQSALDACINQMGSVDCQLGLPDTCDGYLTGTRLQGQGCSLLDECATGLYCTSGINQCGQCAARVANGGDCSNAPCADTLVCATAGNDTVCVPRDANGVGASCGQLNTGLCRGRLQCVGGTCTRPAARGATCDQNLQTAADCDIFAADGCVNGTCTALTWVGIGSTCGDTEQCDNRGTCDAASTTCTALPSSGACVSDRCAPGSYCDSGSCRTRGGTGASCANVSGSCNDGLFCASGSCSALRHISCP